MKYEQINDERPATGSRFRTATLIASVFIGVSMLALTRAKPHGQQLLRANAEPSGLYTGNTTVDLYGEVHATDFLMELSDTLTLAITVENGVSFTCTNVTYEVVGDQIDYVANSACVTVGLASDEYELDSLTYSSENDTITASLNCKCSVPLPVLTATLTKTESAASLENLPDELTPDAVEGTAAIGKVCSDIRLKHDITPLGKNSRRGAPLYTFRYLDEAHGSGLQIGVMAQELLFLGMEDAVLFGADGYYMVDYARV